MIEALSAFHFERPLWLLALVPAIVLFWLAHRAADVVGRWRQVIDAELLKHLLVDSGKRSRVTPNLLLLIGWALAAIAVAGPAWQREPSPFADAKPPVMVVIKVTPSMTTGDLAPTRLDRARQKLSDLLALREGASTGLVAYSGSAHLVLPPTPDAQVVVDLAKALEPGIMPKEGDDLAGAVAMARRVLSGGGHGGSVLVMADTVSGEQLSRLGGAGAGESTILAMVPPNLDATALDEAARALGATVIATTPDQADVTALARRLDNVGRISEVAGEGEHWKEAGYWLTPLFALLVLLWFRRGWVLT
jgi:Ca-activated chloride channel family protein